MTGVYLCKFRALYVSGRFTRVTVVEGSRHDVAANEDGGCTAGPNRILRLRQQERDVVDAL